MAARFHITVSTAFCIIRDIIHTRFHKKRSVHQLYPAIIENRRARTRGMHQ